MQMFVKRIQFYCYSHSLIDDTNGVRKRNYINTKARHAYMQLPPTYDIKQDISIFVG